MTDVGRVYGKALYCLCCEEGLSDQVLTELAVMEASFARSPEFIRLLSSPALPKAERCGIVDDSFRGRVQPYLLNFLKILTKKGYMCHFSDCYSAYLDSYNKDNSILSVTVTTAVVLGKAQVKRLTEKLSAMTGKMVTLCIRIDSAVVGGVRLDFDGKRLEDTIAGRMDCIRSLLKNTVL